MQEQLKINIEQEKNVQKVRSTIHSKQISNKKLHFIFSKQEIVDQQKQNIQICQQKVQQIDYRKLYEEQKIRTCQMKTKIQKLQKKIHKLQQQKLQTGYYIQHSKHNIMNKSHKSILNSIKQFKNVLPNTMKLIDFSNLDDFSQCKSAAKTQSSHNNSSDQQETSINQAKAQVRTPCKSTKTFQSGTNKHLNDNSLIDCMAIYQLSKQVKYDQQLQEDIFEGELVHCSRIPHQIVKHSARLVFPQKIFTKEVKHYQSQQAVDNALINLGDNSKSTTFKAFSLIFQPVNQIFQRSLDSQQALQHRQDQVIDIVNKQRRFYAFCLSYQDFDVVSSTQQNNKTDIVKEFCDNENQEQFNQNAKSKLKCNVVKFQQSTNEINYAITITRKVLTFFTKYPFLPFFQSLLIGCLKQSLFFRMQKMRENIQRLSNFDHSKSIQFLRKFYSQLCDRYCLNKNFEQKLNKNFQISYKSSFMSNQYNKMSLLLSPKLLTSYYAQLWAYPILKLFSLDSFLDVFTLMMLEEKIVFVSENQHVLTGVIFLFTKVFIAPFNYPYPVVSMIPNEYDYFNAPFPIVYGCFNNKQTLLRQKVTKKYKNVYIFLTPMGAQIHCQQNLSKILSKKSPKLRDKLLPQFIKMNNPQEKVSPSRLGRLTTLFRSSSTPANPQFNLSQQNSQICQSIIQKLFAYMKAIKSRFPSKLMIKETRKSVEIEIRNKKLSSFAEQMIDVDKKVYDQIKLKMLKGNFDPFVEKFVDTQIITIQLLK